MCGNSVQKGLALQQQGLTCTFAGKIKRADSAAKKIQGIDESAAVCQSELRSTPDFPHKSFHNGVHRHHSRRGG